MLSSEGAAAHTTLLLPSGLCSISLIMLAHCTFNRNNLIFQQEANHCRTNLVPTSPENCKERAPVDGSNRPNATPPAQSHTWDRTDRIRLLIWVGIAFLPPSACVFALHLAPGGGGSAFTVQRELPAKAIMAFL